MHLVFRTSLQNMRFSMGEQEVYSMGIAFLRLMNGKSMAL
jgi:hypothetical protein